ncbi:MAG TPA: reverse transcriptase/maturase family protein [Desulfuromonadaceae bacterium]
MPTTHSHLWLQIANFEALLSAYRAAARHKRYRRDSLAYRERLEENIINTLNLLIWKEWQPAPYRQFYVHDPKRRLISAPAFKDRVVHHALFRVLEPLFECRFIADSYACRTGKGTHAAKERVEAFTVSAHRQWDEYYVLKADISAYFHSIDRQTLMGIIARTVSDPDVLWLIERIVILDGDRRGLPIGALPSQLFANAYLDVLDHHIKDGLGVRMYARYMDDFLIVHPDKAYLRQMLAEIEAFLTDRLHLTLNPKTAIFKSGRASCRPVDFCGYRIWPGYTKPRKRTVKRAKKRFRKLSERYAAHEIGLDRVRASVASFLGYMRHCNGAASTASALEHAVLCRPSDTELWEAGE